VLLFWATLPLQATRAAWSLLSLASFPCDHVHQNSTQEQSFKNELVWLFTTVSFNVWVWDEQLCICWT
jgi:hypothetical protein